MTTLRFDHEASQRRSRRIRYYRGEFSGVEIDLNSRTYPGQVFDISSDGLGIITDSNIEGLEFSGQNVCIRFTNLRSRSMIGRICNVCLVKFSGEFRTKIGIEVASRETIDNEQEAILCPLYFRPHAYADDPVAFSRSLLFEVLSFSKSQMTLVTSTIDCNLFPGFVLELNLAIPIRGEYSLVFDILTLEQENERTIVKGQLVDVSDKCLAAISEYLLMTVPNMSLTKLRNLGFLVNTIEHALHFKTSQSQKDMDRILDLRLLTAQKSGRWTDTNDSGVMLDAIDAYSRQIFCSVGEKVISCARIVFNNGNPDRCEHSQYNIEIPDWLWEEGFIESSRVCTHPSYRGSELFISLLTHIARVTVQSGYRYLVINCVDSLVPIYKRIGAKNMGQRFHTPYMGTETLNLLVVDTRKGVLGTHLKPASWVPCGLLSDYLLERGNIRASLLERCLRAISRIFGSFAIKIHEKKILKKAKKTRSNSTEMAHDNITTTEKDGKDQDIDIDKHDQAS